MGKDRLLPGGAPRFRLLLQHSLAWPHTLWGLENLPGPFQRAFRGSVAQGPLTGLCTWWQVMSRAVQTKNPEMACAAVVIRNTGCSMAVGLPSGITDTLGEAAMVVGDAGSGASAAPLTVMVPGSRGP